jgi:membrane-bound ClpP family serine protease
MRKFLLITAIIFAILGIIFAVLPLGTIAFLPIIIAIIASLLAFYKSSQELKKLPRIILIISSITLLVVVAKVVLIKDKVATDKQFEIKKEESKKEDMKDLEGL